MNDEHKKYFMKRIESFSEEEQTYFNDILRCCHTIAFNKQLRNLVFDIDKFYNFIRDAYSKNFTKDDLIFCLNFLDRFGYIELYHKKNKFIIKQKYDDEKGDSEDE